MFLVVVFKKKRFCEKGYWRKDTKKTETKTKASTM